MYTHFWNFASKSGSDLYLKDSYNLESSYENVKTGQYILIFFISGSILKFGTRLQLTIVFIND